MQDDTGKSFHKTCRTCLDTDYNQEELIPLFESASDMAVPSHVLDIIDVFQLSIKQDDGFPQHICPKCLEAFTSISQFKKQCVEVQEQLGDIFPPKSDAPDPKLQLNHEQMISFEIVLMNSDDELVESENEFNSPMKENIAQDHTFKRKSPDDSNDEESDTTIYRSTNRPSRDGETKILKNESNKGDKIVNAVKDESISEISLHSQCDAASVLNDKTSFSLPASGRRRYYSCPLCSRKFNHPSNRNNHLQTHNDKNSFSCDICGQNFKSKLYVLRHKRSVHEEAEYQCSICNETLKNLKRYNYHMLSHNPVKKYKCSYCDRSFMQQHHMLNHERTHTGVEPYLCNVCGKSFKQETNLKKHCRLHTGERPYECKVCRKRFVQRGTFVLHMRRHDNIRPFQCEICGKDFVQRSSLTIHLRVHTGDRPFKCDECSKAFIQAHQLKYHKYSSHQLPVVDKQDIHLKSTLSANATDKKGEGNANKECTNNTENDTNFYPYSCPICSRGFKLPSSLKSHLKCHSEERKYACQECGNTFKRAEHLRIHINGVHLKKKPYACYYCDKTFSQSGDRNIHMKQHMVEKPHKCQYCNKGFRLQKSLRSHERIHTGVKPYMCEICEMCFISYNALAIHTMKHSYVEKRMVNEKTLSEFKKSIVENRKPNPNAKQEGFSTNALDCSFDYIEINPL